MPSFRVLVELHKEEPQVAKSEKNDQPMSEHNSSSCAVFLFLGCWKVGLKVILQWTLQALGKRPVVLKVTELGSHSQAFEDLSGWYGYKKQESNASVIS